MDFHHHATLICYPSLSTNLDIPHRKMTILAPNQGSVAGKTAIVGSYEWQDQ